MLAQQDKNIEKAVEKVHKLSEDEVFRMKCEAREDRIRQEIDRELHWQNQVQEMKDELAQKEDELAQKEDELAQKDDMIAQQEMLIKQLQEQLANK